MVGHIFGSRISAILDFLYLSPISSFLDVPFPKKTNGLNNLVSFLITYFGTHIRWDFIFHLSFT